MVLCLLVSAHAQYEKTQILKNKERFYIKQNEILLQKDEFNTKQVKFYRQVQTSRSEWLLRFQILNGPSPETKMADPNPN